MTNPGGSIQIIVVKSISIKLDALSQVTKWFEDSALLVLFFQFSEASPQKRLTGTQSLPQENDSFHYVLE